MIVGGLIKKSTLIITAALPFLVLSFQNCGQVAVTDIAAIGNQTELKTEEPPPSNEEPPVAEPNPGSPNPTVPNPGTPNTPSSPGTPTGPGYELVRQTCEIARTAGRLKTKTLRLEFPNPGRVCEWGANGNLSAENGKIRARHEAYAQLELNQGAKVCNVEMTNLDRQNFWYDDNIFITLNDYVLASTSNFSQHLESRENLYRYDWSRLVNKNAQNDSSDTTLEKQYCAGRDLNSATSYQTTCSFPITDQFGSIQLSFADSIIQRVLGITTVTDLKLGVITTGDNDGTDCQHVDLNFEVLVHYFEDVYVPPGTTGGN